MANKEDNLTIKQKYGKLDRKKKKEVRNLFLIRFEYEYSTFYNKLNSDNFKTIEREYFNEIL